MVFFVGTSFAAHEARPFSQVGQKKAVLTKAQEARHWQRLVVGNQEQHEREFAQDVEISTEANNLIQAGNQAGANALVRQHAARVYERARRGYVALQARPPTLLLAIQNGCRIPLIQRIIGLYRREMPSRGFVNGEWGVSSRLGPGPTHAAVRAGRVDVLQLLDHEHVYSPQHEWRALVSPVELEGEGRFERFEPLTTAVYEWQDAPAQHLIAAGHSAVTPRHMLLAVRVGAAGMIPILVPAWAQQAQLNADGVPAMLDTLLRLALWQQADRRAVIDALIHQGVNLSGAGDDYQNQQLPEAIRQRQGPGNLVNVTHLLARLVSSHMLSQASFARMVEEAALQYPGHGFLRAAIPFAYMLAPAATHGRAVAQRAGLEHLLRIELTQARRGHPLALRADGVGLLVGAGLPRTTALLAIGRELEGGEAEALVNGVVRAAPLDPPRALRSPHGHGAGAALHPLRWACQVQQPRAAMALIAHGARFPEPAETNWVPNAIWLCWDAVFNNLDHSHRAERTSLIRLCQTGAFNVTASVFDIPNPDRNTFYRQVLSLYMLVFTPPTTIRYQQLLRGAFIARPQWPERIIDMNYYDRS